MTTVFDYTRTHAVRMAFLFSSHSQQSLKSMKSYTKYQMRRATILAASLVSRCRMWSWLRAWYVSRCMCVLCWCARCATHGVFVDFSLQWNLKIMRSYTNYTMRRATILAASLVPRWRTRNLKPLSVTARLHCMLVLLPVKGAGQDICDQPASTPASAPASAPAISTHAYICMPIIRPPKGMEQCHAGFRELTMALATMSCLHRS